MGEVCTSRMSLTSSSSSRDSEYSEKDTTSKAMLLGTSPTSPFFIPPDDDESPWDSGECLAVDPTTENDRVDGRGNNGICCDNDDGCGRMRTTTGSPPCHDRKLTLEEFIGELPGVIGTAKKNRSDKRDDEGAFLCDDVDEKEDDIVKGLGGGSEIEDPIRDLFGRLNLDEASAKALLGTHAYFDPDKSYTRNLVSTDHETYTLLLLCWNADRESPIHDHPCDGCWMRVVRGAVRECRYRSLEPPDDGAADPETLYLECIQDSLYRGCEDRDDVVFIEDSLGYHKVGNPTDQPAVTLHLYVPPIRTCKIWRTAATTACRDRDDGGRDEKAPPPQPYYSTTITCCNYSRRHGQKV